MIELRLVITCILLVLAWLLLRERDSQPGRRP